MDGSLQQPSDIAFAAVVAALWFFPIGAFVLRRYLKDATGVRRVAKIALHSFAWVTGPFGALITVLVLSAGAQETLETLHMLLQAAW